MVLKGLGVAVLPDFLVEEDLKRGRLSDVLPKERLELSSKFKCPGFFGFE
jgi:DNA-binding transcriptional LysR family regulator